MAIAYAGVLVIHVAFKWVYVVDVLPIMVQGLAIPTRKPWYSCLV